MRLLALPALLPALIACGSAPLLSGKALPTPELSVLEAAVAFSTESLSRRRPVLLLRETDPRIPSQLELNQDDFADLPSQAWEELSQPRFPEELRELNDRRFSIANIESPAGVYLHLRRDFNRVLMSRRFETLEASLRGDYPLMLSLSRPYIGPTGTEAFVIMKSHFTWNGCSSVDVVRLERAAAVAGRQSCTMCLPSGESSKNTLKATDASGPGSATAR